MTLTVTTKLSKPLDKKTIYNVFEIREEVDYIYFAIRDEPDKQILIKDIKSIKVLV